MSEKPSWTDRVLALGVGALTLALLLAWPFVGIHPFAADDMAISAGLIPQGRMLPGFGVCLGSLLFRVLPYGLALPVNAVVAKVAVALCGTMAFWIFSGMMTLASGQGARDWTRRRVAIRVAASLGAVAFACSDPMGRAATGVTGTTLVTFLVVLTLFLYVRLLETARGSYALATLFSAGLLCAETPLGWAVLVFGVVTAFRFLAVSKPPHWSEFLDPIRMQRMKWSMTFIFLGAFVLGVFGEAFAYALEGGLRANGVTAAELPLAYARAYWGALTESLDVSGACLFALCVLVPFALSLLMVGPATDEDRFLSLKHSIAYFTVGGLAFLQLAPYPTAWFWTMADGAEVSKTVIAVAALLSGATFAWAAFVLGIEAFCRDYAHIEDVLCQGYLEDGEDEADADRRYGRTESDPEQGDVRSVRLTCGRVLAVVAPVVLVSAVVWGRHQPNDRAVQELVYRFVQETVSETEGVRYLFTDGALDAMIRLEARRLGRELLPISLMGGSGIRETYIRQLGCESAEDRAALAAGAVEALGTWVSKTPDRLADVAVQLAFEQFGRNRRLKPVVYGAVVRPVGGNAEDASKSAARSRALARRIVALHEQGLWRRATDSVLKDKLLFVQFRLAVMGRLRALYLDSEKKTEESREALACADKLNEHNPSVVEISRKMDWVRRQRGEFLTPREGLELALQRADFVRARRYAVPIVKGNAEDPDANFALAMSYYVEGQYAKAEEYLLNCLKQKPREAAVYNNLALVCLKTGRLVAAETNANKALEICPGRMEIIDTARQIEKALEARKKGFEGFRAR